MLVDSHCHLDRLDLNAHDGSLDAALEAARQRGVGHFLCIGVSAENAGAVKALSEQYADVDCSVGVHPLDLAPGETPALEWLLRELAQKEGLQLEQTIAVGDGANDLPMLGLAGLGVAFRAKPLVKQSAKQAISTLGLDGILYLLGFRDREGQE